MRALSMIASVLFLFAVGACSGNTQNSDQGSQIAENVNAQKMNELIQEKKDVIILDVRTKEELQGGWIPNAQNVDFYQEGFAERLTELDRNKPVFVYCAAGGRSGKAMKMMNDLGFSEVYNLSGGFPTWKQAGFEVAK